MGYQQILETNLQPLGVIVLAFINILRQCSSMYE
jgi:hypothetical protein